MAHTHLPALGRLEDHEFKGGPSNIRRHCLKQANKNLMQKAMCNVCTLDREVPQVPDFSLDDEHFGLRQFRWRELKVLLSICGICRKVRGADLPPGACWLTAEPTVSASISQLQAELSVVQTLAGIWPLYSQTALFSPGLLFFSPSFFPSSTLSP